MMADRTRLAATLACLALLGVLVTAFALRRCAGETGRTDTGFFDKGPPVADLSYTDYAAVLTALVDDNGRVNYAGLQADPAALNRFVTLLARLDPETYADLGPNGQVAFWINAYNALTLRAVVHHYPIKAGFLRGRLYPKNSIRQIPGVWDELEFTAMGRRMTLDHIEHRILRKEFGEPRIHMALVCAAVSCPRLRNEPYEGDRLDAQLEDQSRGFIRDPRKFRVDRARDRVYLSSIFKWFGGDFVATYGKGRIGGLDDVESAVIRFAARHVAEADRDYLLAGTFQIQYVDYDWSLNEQKGP